MTRLLGLVLIAMLLPFPFASIGTTTDATWASVLAVAVMGLAALVPPVLRYAGPAQDGD